MSSSTVDPALELMDEYEEPDGFDAGRFYGADDGRERSDEQGAEFQFFEDGQVL